MSEKVAIIIKTVLRERSFFNTFHSIVKFCNFPYRLYIYDDGPITKKKNLLYEEIRNAGHFVYVTTEFTSPTAARVFLHSRLQEEKYVLRIDDDFEFFDKTNIRAMVELLNVDSSHGAVAGLEIQKGKGKGTLSGKISHMQGLLIRDKGTLIKKCLDYKYLKYNWQGSLRYTKLDFTRNFLLLKRQMLDEIMWDTNIPFGGEHLDLMLQIYTSKQWSLVFTPDSVHKHREDLNKEDKPLKYYDLKNSSKLKSESFTYFLDKWNLTAVKRKKIWKQKVTEWYQLAIKKLMS